MCGEVRHPSPYTLSPYTPSLYTPWVRSHLHPSQQHPVQTSAGHDLDAVSAPRVLQQDPDTFPRHSNPKRFAL